MEFHYYTSSTFHFHLSSRCVSFSVHYVIPHLMTKNKMEFRKRQRKLKNIQMIRIHKIWMLLTHKLENIFFYRSIVFHFGSNDTENRTSMHRSHFSFFFYSNFFPPNFNCSNFQQMHFSLLIPFRIVVSSGFNVNSRELRIV